MHALIFLGVDNTKLHAFFDGKVPVIEDARSMEEAVSKAYKLAEREIPSCCHLAVPASTSSKAMRIEATSSKPVCVTCKEKRRDEFSK